jgi:hypothetical protein
MFRAANPIVDSQPQRFDRLASRRHFCLRAVSTPLIGSSRASRSDTDAFLVA